MVWALLLVDCLLLESVCVSIDSALLAELVSYGVYTGMCVPDLNPSTDILNLPKLNKLSR